MEEGELPSNSGNSNSKVSDGRPKPDRKGQGGRWGGNPNNSNSGSSGGGGGGGGGGGNSRRDNFREGDNRRPYRGGGRNDSWGRQSRHDYPHRPPSSQGVDHWGQPVKRHSSADSWGGGDGPSAPKRRREDRDARDPRPPSKSGGMPPNSSMAAVPPPPPPPPTPPPRPGSAPPPPPKAPPPPQLRISKVHTPRYPPAASPVASGSGKWPAPPPLPSPHPMEVPPSPMVSANKEKKKQLLKIIDALDLAVNRAEANLEKVETQRDEILEYMESKDGAVWGKEAESHKEVPKPEVKVEKAKGQEANKEEQAVAALQESLAKQRRKMLKLNVPIGPLVNRVLEENRMSAFAARVELMKISVCPGPGMPDKRHLVGGPHIPPGSSYADFMDLNPMPLYQSPMETPQWAYNEARHNQIFPYVLRSVAMRRAGIAYHGKNMRRRYDAANVEWKERLRKLHEAGKDGKLSQKKAPPSTPKLTRLTRNSSAGFALSEEDQERRLKAMMEEEMRQQQFRKTLAVVPPMIFDRKERRIKMMLANSNGLVRDVIRDEREERHKNMWSDAEKTIFLVKFLQFPKEFWKISKFLTNKSTNDVVAFYYNTKHKVDYKNFLKQHMGIRVRQRSGKEVTGDEERYGKVNELMREKAGRRALLNPEKKDKFAPTINNGGYVKRKSAQAGAKAKSKDSKAKQKKPIGQPELLSSSVWALVRGMASRLGVNIPAFGSTPMPGQKVMDGGLPACLHLADLVRDSAYSEWAEDHWTRFMPVPHVFQQQPMPNERLKENPSTKRFEWETFRIEKEQPLDYYQYRLIGAARSCSKAKHKPPPDVRHRVASINSLWKNEFTERMKARRELIQNRRMAILQSMNSKKKKPGKGAAKKGNGGGKGSSNNSKASGKHGAKNDKKKKKKGKDKDRSGSKSRKGDGDKQKKAEEAVAVQQTNKWSPEEKQTFLKYLRSCGKDWPKIAVHIPSKTHAQIRNFYQNYKYKLDLPGILKQRDNELLKAKKKADKEAKAKADKESRRKDKKRKKPGSSGSESSSGGSKKKAKLPESRKRNRPMLKGVDRPPNLHPAVSALASIAKAGTPRALKEVRRLFHTGRLTPKASPDAPGASGSKNK